MTLLNILSGLHFSYQNSEVGTVYANTIYRNSAHFVETAANIIFLKIFLGRIDLTEL